MIKKISGVIVLTTFYMSALQAAEINAVSNIKAVTVYPSSAKVTRVSTIHLMKGDNEIIIDNLPVNLNESSLRVTGDSTASVSLGSVELNRNIKRDVIQQNEREIREKIENIKEQKKEIEDALTRNQSQLQYIQKMVIGSNPQPSLENNEKTNSYTSLPLEQWNQAWQTLDEATANVQEKIRNANKSLKELNKELRKQSRELSLVSVNQSETRTARLQVESEEETELTLSLNYQINGAYWSPIYDADLNTQTGEIELKTLAQISQRTGEDWNNAAVTLSTLRPSAGTQLPPLNTWTIDLMPDFYVAQDTVMMEANESVVMDRMYKKSVEPMIASSAGIAKSIRKPKKKMRQVQTQIISTDFSAEYKVPGKISLKSGSNKRRFALRSQKYQSKIHLASAPRLDPRAMILAKTKYTGETPLLAGALALYRNGSFVGNTRLDQKQSGEEIKLSFGEDDKVKIKFLPDPDKNRKDGLLFGKKKVVERHYKVSVTNNHETPFSITLYDAIPVAINEQIKVVKTGDSPTTSKVDDKEGVLNWVRTLAPKKEIKIKYGYTVSYPEDKEISDL